MDLVVVSGGSIVLDAPAQDVVAGLPYRHEIEPMPAAPAVGRTSPLAPAYRPIRVTLRVFDTRSLRIDTGDGFRELPLVSVSGGAQAPGPAPFSGDLALRAIGWRRGADQPPWRIEQDAPLPCMVLSVTTEVKVND